MVHVLLGALVISMAVLRRVELAGPKHVHPIQIQHVEVIQRLQFKIV